ncbi:retinal pigment epithelial membrane family protein [Mycolicibacterium hassiacum DSM 44199]|jgi:carotenoid cleavage dioxygenase|uniref:Dioxygenase n=1 Tax=Mycolicibacterium hassiacum (strain DSM 44199 / CIP 105218 / JCM 12690 / 3849) TaxID=1122247 RepID=K5B7H5_MYCHD|nr:carotenoid oxygenase family protein [Mycolicibacterium hassiacum]EKF21958.1 retinal pigment epithelial membrane family protein [Mycolicibacterium hassiacum DSM 44199]MDA4086864.1 carotenoid cleavage dioxygenase [Mycolicibacterium hassiacum DSM 44199]VCT92171.1 8'-apo-carotenoid 13,14-cleaving dioxygenase [Mycolicibacterium hassiacum DSM 44199]
MTQTDDQATGEAEPFFRRGNYAPVPDEISADELPVDGAIPTELHGWYLRNGPNPRRPTDHWFVGDGMIHGVHLEGGRARWYRNRWVRTDSFDNDFPVYNPDGTRNLRSSVANTHVINHAGRTLALVESSLPYEITTELKTVGAYDFNGRLTDSMTAHPKICPVTGELHFFGYGSIFKPHVTYLRADANGELTINRPVDVPALTMMHDFALTAGHVLFLDLPIVFNLDIAIKGEGMPYRWDDDYGARLGVLRRDDPFGEIRWFDIEPCYVFHVANAYDDADSIVLQAVRYPELWRDNSGFDAVGVLWSWTIDLRTGTVTERQLDDRDIEFPRIDDRRAGLPARYAVAVGGNRLIRYDLNTGAGVEHRFGSAESPGGPGEFVFVPSVSGPADESSGWYLGYVYDPARDGSDLVILDAADFTGEPVARVRLPRRVPYGFHGNWIPA